MLTRVVELDNGLVEVLNTLNQPLDRSVHEMVVLELYRRGLVSSGKAAELLQMAKVDFIHYAGALGIPLIRYDEGELTSEIADFIVP